MIGASTALDPAADAERKRRAKLAAGLALRGYELRELAGGGWLIVRWNLSRPANTLDDAEDFARSVGAPL